MKKRLGKIKAWAILHEGKFFFSEDEGVSYLYRTKGMAMRIPQSSLHPTVKGYFVYTLPPRKGRRG